eukprot:TRINITY_DN6382_c0_g1_i1.p1 TRINITY_DN6382_c0_g1~~TRINITY_DN6382_c0_g1_i1.p1  ORF type:complete len:396 (+),score=62.01 TRINITY_DN6382_c0_g1_i1:46-1188(+)
MSGGTPSTSLSCQSWGKPRFTKETVALMGPDGAPIFEIPISSIENQSATKKSGDVIMELDGDDEGCCEIRLNMREGYDMEGGVDGGKNTAESFVQILKAKQSIRSSIDLGPLVVEFKEISSLVPRGLFSLKIHSKHLHLVGKASKNAKTMLEWTIPLNTISESGMYLLDNPNSAESKWMCVSLTKPIRSGNVAHSCLVFQVEDDIVEINVNLSPLTDEQKNVKTKDGEPMITENMNGPLAETAPKCLKSISGAKLITPLPDVGPFAVSDKSGKQGFLFCLKKSLLFAPNPAIPIRHDKISVLTFTDVHSGGNTLGVQFKMQASTLAFQGLDREDLPAITAYAKSKGINVDGLNKEEEDALSDISSADNSSYDRKKKKARH